MFDSAGGNFPPGAQTILLPSDGAYAKGNPAVQARFPHAEYQYYTAVGQNPARWIDVEPGCVWPPQQAVDLFHRWAGNGVTEGFYCAKSTKPALEQLLAPADRPEWFEADPTNVPHVLPGDTETQWGWFGGFDESEIAAAPLIKHGPPPPVAAPIAPGDDDMKAQALTDPATGGVWVVNDRGAVEAVGGVAPYLGGSNNPAQNPGGFPCVGICAFTDGSGAGYTLVVDTGDDSRQGGRYALFHYPRSGTAKAS
jgi:hypothetical protein